MSLTIEEYRIRIGQFYHRNNTSKKKKTEVKITLTTKMKISCIIFCILSLLFYPHQNTPTKPNSSYRAWSQLYGSTTFPQNVSSLIPLHNSSLNWSYLGLSNNKLQCLINDNRRALGYKLAVWNCGRGLLSGDSVSSKFQDIKLYIQSKTPHVFGVIETDIHSPLSSANRTNKFTTSEVKSNLDIPGYSLLFPPTWEAYGQARILVYVSNDIKYKVKRLTNSHNDLPSISLEIGLGRATKTLVNYYYREWTGGVTGDSSMVGQLQRLDRHISQWKELSSQGRDFVSLGDANLCALSWNQSDFKYKNLAQNIQSFLLDDSCHQLVNTYTRIQSYRDTVQRSCLDHIVTNVPNKCDVPEVSAGGSSDHMAVLVIKRSREIKNQPKTIKKRNYKHFNEASFLHDVSEALNSGAFDTVLSSTDPNIAAAHFSGIFSSILNKHAPLKIFQVRNNYVPWISEETGQAIRQRDKLKQEALSENYLNKLNDYKALRNKIKNQLPKDEENYYKNKFYSKEASVGSVWNYLIIWELQKNLIAIHPLCLFMKT